MDEKAVDLDAVLKEAVDLVPKQSKPSLCFLKFLFLFFIFWIFRYLGWLVLPYAE